MAAFFAVLLLIPAISAMKSKSKGANEYFKSAGSMPWWLIGVSMVAATTSTNSANLFTEIIRRDGLSGNWAWLIATFLTKPEKPEVIANFKALVRADGRDVGKGLLKMFIASIAIFAFMWAIGLLIGNIK